MVIRLTTIAFNKGEQYICGMCEHNFTTAAVVSSVSFDTVDRVYICSICLSGHTLLDLKEW